MLAAPQARSEIGSPRSTRAPQTHQTDVDRATPKYLDDNLLETPELALDRVRLEMVRTGEMVLDIVRQAPEIILRGSREQLAELEALDDDIDELHLAIVTYLGRLSQEGLTEAQTETLHDYMRLHPSKQLFKGFTPAEKGLGLFKS